MNRCTLIPFGGGASETDYSVEAVCQLEGHAFQIQFIVNGPCEHLTWVPTAAPGVRQHELWTSTCFECFISDENSDAYWELNVTPDAAWSFYVFDGYRTGMKEAFLADPKIIAKVAGHRIHVTVSLDIKSFMPVKTQKLNVGITAILHREDQRSYWALRHCGSRPDFHIKDSFQLKLENKTSYDR